MGGFGEWWTSPLFEAGEWKPIAWKFFVAIILFLFSWVAFYVLKLIFTIIMKLVDKALPDEITIDDDIVKYCMRPFCKLGKVFVWWVAVALLSFPEGAVGDVINRIILAVFFWYLLKLGLGVINVVRDWYLRRGHTQSQTQSIRFMIKIAKAVWCVVFGIFILENLGIKVDNILAYTVVFVAGLAFAARDVMANFYGGVRINLMKPFHRGENIALKGKFKYVSGVVAKVGLSDTTIKSDEGYLIVVPNQLFVTETVINNSRNVDDELALVTAKEEEEGLRGHKAENDYPPPTTPEDGMIAVRPA